MRWFILILLYILIDIYAFQAIRTISSHKLLLAAYILVSVLVLAYFIYHSLTSSHGISSPGMRYAFGFLLVWLSPKIAIVLFMFGEDVIRLVTLLYQKLTSAEVTQLAGRRKFVSMLALGIAAVPFGALLYGMYRGKYQYRVLEYELAFEDLPDAFDGYQITQISDIHSGSLDHQEKVAYGVDMINAQESDIILFTGDIVNNEADELTPWQPLFGSLKAKDGVYSVLGNHDYGDYIPWPSPEAKTENLQALIEMHSQMGWKLLLNESHTIQRDADLLHILGVENWGHGFVKKGDIDRAAGGLGKSDFKILLSHDPSYWDEQLHLDDRHFQLTLSGHTHGMQFGIEIPGWIKWSPVQYRYKRWAGIYEELGRYLNVNRGFGYLAYPGRVGIWPEVTVITLRKSRS